MRIDDYERHNSYDVEYQLVYTLDKMLPFFVEECNNYISCKEKGVTPDVIRDKVMSSLEEGWIDNKFFIAMMEQVCADSEEYFIQEREYV